MGRVEHHEPPRPAGAVMPRNDARHPRGKTGHGPGVEEGIGEVRARAVEGHLARAVGIHGEEDAAVRVGEVGVLPAQVEYPPVGEDRGIPSVLLVEGEAPDGARGPAEAIEVGHVGRAEDAGHAHVGGRGREEDVAPGQVAGIVVVHVGLIDLGDGRGLARGEVELEDAPPPGPIQGRIEEPPAVEVEVHVSRETARGLVDHGEIPVGAGRIEPDQGVAVPGAGQGLVALPVGGQAQVGRARGTSHEEDLQVFEQGIGEQRLVGAGQDGLDPGQGG